MSSKKRSRRAGVSRTLIWDVAEQSGVSIATVSRVLNGRPDVSLATRERVMQYIRELGYVSNRHAHAVSGRNTSYIGFTVPQVGSPYFGKILEGVTEAVQERDAHLVVYRNRYTSDISPVQRLSQGATRGAVLVLPSEKPEELLQLRQRGYPFVVIDPFFSLPDDIPVIASANMTGARMAVEHLLTLGHRRIAAITGPTHFCATADRLAGYHSVLAVAGIPHNPAYVYEADFTLNGGRKAAHHLLNLSEAPTAIFAFNDDMAVGVLQVAQERGIKVPEELSVVGFDDATWTSFAIPALTSVRQPAREFGRVGVEILYRLMQGQPLEVSRIELSTRLIVRASTAPCNIQA